PFRARALLRPRLLWLRALHAVYAPELAVEVLARLLPERPDAHLVLGGRDKGDGSRERVRARARALGVERALTLLPGVPAADVYRQLEAADLFLCTSRVDNAPLSVLEAMAAGLPVVAPAVGGLP